MMEEAEEEIVEEGMERALRVKADADEDLKLWKLGIWTLGSLSAAAPNDVVMSWGNERGKQKETEKRVGSFWEWESEQWVSSI